MARISDLRSKLMKHAPVGPRRARLGVAAEPVLETCRAEARVIAWCEALIVHRNAEVERLGIGDYRPCVPGRVQELPHEVVLTDRFGTGQIDRAVQRLTEGRIGHDGGD